MHRVRLLATVYQERKKLPGNIRQWLKSMIDALAGDHRPHNSTALQLDDVETVWEARRIRVDGWRIIYAIDDDLQQIAILAVRKRPPYDYDDLDTLLSSLE